MGEFRGRGKVLERRARERRMAVQRYFFYVGASAQLPVRGRVAKDTYYCRENFNVQHTEHIQKGKR